MTKNFRDDDDDAFFGILLTLVNYRRSINHARDGRGVIFSAGARACWPPGFPCNMLTPRSVTPTDRPSAVDRSRIVEEVRASVWPRAGVPEQQKPEGLRRHVGRAAGQMRWSNCSASDKRS